MKLILALTLLATNAWAHCRPSSVSETISTKTVYTSQTCTQFQPLELARVTQSYSKIGTLTVDAWTGAFQRPTRTTEVVRVTRYRCDGSPLGQQTYKEQTESVAMFAVDNPNLRFDVQTSFEANAPMTDAEAALALRLTEAKCLSGAQPTAK